MRVEVKAAVWLASWNGWRFSLLIVKLFVNLLYTDLSSECYRRRNRSRSRSRNRSHKRVYDLVKIEYRKRSRKRSHKLDGIGVGRIRTFPFPPIPFTTPSLMIQWKLGCRSRKQKRNTQPIARPRIEHCHWFILPLLLATPTMQFSLVRKRRSHKQNQCSASDSVGLVFTRSYRFTLLITTPTTTPSLVKTNLTSSTGFSVFFFFTSAKSDWETGSKQKGASGSW